MKTGARNDIVGVVAEIKRGSLMGQAKVKVSGEVQLSSVMTLDSIDELDLKPGDKVRVVVKAVNVLLIKD
jgi:molybdopterin-binding protein